MNKTLAFAIVTALSTGSVAFAHAGKGHGKHFERMDQNTDGKVTLEEMKTGAGQHFTQVDSDKDGRITQEEAKAFHETMRREHEARRAAKGDDQGRKGPPAGMHERAQRHFAKQDANGDGAIERSEHEAGVAKRFARMDKNADGVVTKDELGRGHGKGDCADGERGHGKGHGKHGGHGRGGDQGAAGAGAEQ